MRFVTWMLLFACCFTGTLRPLVYNVKDDDALWTIAQSYHCKVEDILLINELVSEQIFKNQKLVIPEEIRKYTVQPGNSLIKIASKNSSKVEYIILYNNLATETLYLGQVLFIPVTQSAEMKKSVIETVTVLHTVAPGETLSHIALKYKVSVGDLMKWNSKTQEGVYSGEKIKIVLPKDSVKPQKPLPAQSAPPANKDIFIQHKVEKNETLSGIALKCQVSQDDILKWNKKSGGDIYIGETLLIKKTPVNDKSVKKEAPIQKTVHTVKPGDTLTAIAKKYQTTVEEIINLNKKPSYSIFIGEKLIVPLKTPVNVVSAQTPDKNWNKKPNDVILSKEKKSPPPKKTVKGKPWDKTKVFAVQPGKIAGVDLLERGILIELNSPQKVKTMGTGIVEYAGYVNGYNNIVIVKYPDNKRAVYGYLSEIYVKENQTVKEGDYLGKVDYSSVYNKVLFYLELREGKQSLTVYQCFPFLEKFLYIAKK